MWKGVAAKLNFRPEDGLEVICTGKLTTYPGRSKYQIVIDTMEVAGAGALMALLEERKKKLAAEGLFDPACKKPIPFIPQVIGVVTSPTGAVIRDILHRLDDRFPRHVLVWPVIVQGKGADLKIAAAIRGFNNIQTGGDIPRPDVIIVARGGGSLEDLWSFNEEAVVRATAASDIPIISAVGHETDTTLIDFASDHRAPTPTAAAERAVPVRLDLIYTVDDLRGRLNNGLRRMFNEKKQYLEGLARGLPKPEELLNLARQKMDELSDRLPRALGANVQRNDLRLSKVTGRLSPRVLVQKMIDYKAQVRTLNDRSSRSLKILTEKQKMRLEHLSHGLRADPLLRDVLRARERMDALKERLERAMTQRLQIQVDRLESPARLLMSLSYERSLERGFAVVRDEKGRLVSAGEKIKSGAGLEIQFKDRRVAVVAAGSSAKLKAKPKKTSNDQGMLL
jgi:exodeoxyribonuclease VII large subunit